jgi:hypothetical protein
MSILEGTTVSLGNLNITPSTIAPFFNYTATILGDFLQSAPRLLLVPPLLSNDRHQQLFRKRI